MKPFRFPTRAARHTPAANLEPIDQPRWPHHVKQAAYEIDPECWVSYSGKPRDFKRAVDARRLATLEKAAESTSASRTAFSPS